MDLPPPAYDVSQLEFDQKTATALETSLQTPDPVSQEDESWQEWDEAAYEAAARALRRSNSGEGSSFALRAPLVSVAPLRIQKSTESKVPARGIHLAKQRPSWLADAALDSSSTASSSSAEYSSALLPALHVTNGEPEPPSPLFTHYDIPEDDEDRSIPPPAFTAVGPSLDGPPFEEVVTLAYHGNDLNPASLLMSPVPYHTSLAYATHTNIPRPLSQQTHHHPPYQQYRPLTPESRIAPQPQYRQSLPTAQRPPRQHISSRPMTTYTPRLMQPSATEFDHSIAYTTRGGSSESPNYSSASSYSINAAEFYNPAVSAHLTPSKNTKVNRPTPTTKGSNKSPNTPSHPPPGAYNRNSWMPSSSMSESPRLPDHHRGQSGQDRWATSESQLNFYQL